MDLVKILCCVVLILYGIGSMVQRFKPSFKGLTFKVGLWKVGG